MAKLTKCPECGGKIETGYEPSSQEYPGAQPEPAATVTFCVDDCGWDGIVVYGSCIEGQENRRGW